MQGWIFLAVRRHKAKQGPAIGIGSCLVGKVDDEHSVFAEQTGRVMHHATRRQTRTWVSNRRNSRLCHGGHRRKYADDQPGKE